MTQKFHSEIATQEKLKYVPTNTCAQMFIELCVTTVEYIGAPSSPRKSMCTEAVKEIPSAEDKSLPEKTAADYPPHAPKSIFTRSRTNSTWSKDKVFFKNEKYINQL